MQIMPETADYIARKSGGTRFTRADLATPQINIAYGTWYLRYLLDKYKGNTILTLAAYNAGEGKVDEWRAAAAAKGEKFRVAEPHPVQGDARLRRSACSPPARTTGRSYATKLGLNDEGARCTRCRPEVVGHRLRDRASGCAGAAA